MNQHSLQENLASGTSRSTGTKEKQNGQSCADSIFRVKMVYFMIIIWERNGIVSAACFYPLYAGMVTKEEAKKAVAVLPKIEMTYGVAACEKCEHIPGNFQWGYPNGWPPMQRVVAEGLLRYGYVDEARRIGEKYIALVDNCLETTGNLWEKYNVVDGNVEVVDEYKMPAMLGWTFGVYYWFCRFLDREL